jgi:hypothetical protein
MEEEVKGGSDRAHDDSDWVRASFESRPPGPFALFYAAAWCAEHAYTHIERDR